MDWLQREIEQLLLKLDWGPTAVEWGARIVWLVIIFVISILLAKIFRHFFIPLLQQLSRRTKMQWDDHLFKDEVMHKAARLIPPVVWSMPSWIRYTTSPS